MKGSYHKLGFEFVIATLKGRKEKPYSFLQNYHLFLLEQNLNLDITELFWVENSLEDKKVPVRVGT